MVPPVTNNKPVTPVTDWCAFSEAQAILELCTRLNIRLSVKSDGTIWACGNPEAVPEYLSGITYHYRGIVIAHLQNRHRMGSHAKIIFPL